MSTTQLPREQVLIGECLDGRVEAFAELIGPYQDRLHNMLYRMVGSAEEAAELLQETLLRAYRGLSDFAGEAAFYTWLYRIALNVVFSASRRKHLKMVSTASAAGDQAHQLADPRWDGQPDHALERRETQALVQQALAETTESFRVVLVLKDIEGLPYEQIAELLEIPLGTVRSRLFRGRLELRQRLQPLLERGAL